MEADNNEEQGQEDEAPQPELRSAPPAAVDEEHSEICVGNLPWKVDENMLQEYLTYYGPVVKCKILYDDDGRSKGIGFVGFEKAEDAQKACNEGGEMDGRRLRVNMSNQRPTNTRTNVEVNPEAEGSNCVFIGNLSFEATEDDVRTLFSSIGAL